MPIRVPQALLPLCSIIILNQTQPGLCCLGMPGPWPGSQSLRVALLSEKEVDN